MARENQVLLAQALGELRRLKQENAALKQAGPVAVVGMACRFPGGCDDPESYWNFLAEGRCAVRPTPLDRTDGTVSGFGAYLEDKDLFDAAFFGISPKEARSLDPQQRLLLELAWHAFESGNLRPDELAGREVGVFVGMSGIDYALKLFSRDNRAHIDPYFGTGTTLSPAAGRIAYYFKFNGPAMVVDTACSSSLVAIHLAVESLRRGECEAALAAGVNRILGPELSLNFAQSGLLAPDGACRAFDARAQGYARGEGGGVLVLKRLADAKAAGDQILAVIVGSAVNQDGGSGGLTVPSGPAQQKVIRRALQVAGRSPADVDYVEAHGTATPLGDPIEANALGGVFGADRTPGRPLLIGSVKTNFGHLEAAAGMASCCKVIQALRHEAIPPQLNFTEPSPHIDWARLPLRVVDVTRPWLRTARPRIAGVSGFGFAGTNAHLVLTEAPAVSPDQATAPPRAELIVLSARTVEALRAQAGNLAACVEALPDEDWAAAAAAAQEGRVPLTERLALVDGRAGAAGALRAYAAAGRARGVAASRVGEPVRTAFVFTGQGAQYVGMGRGLYTEYPVFRQIVDTCAERLQPALGRDLREVLFAAAPPVPVPAVLAAGPMAAAPLAEIDQTLFTQAGLFTLEYGLARLWESWGVRPALTLGHSVGEYAAACVAGVFSLEDALRLVAERGRLMQERSAPGAMLTVFGAEAVVAGIVAPYAASAAIAAVNGPEIVLVSGAAETVEILAKQFAAAQLRVVRMRISHAFHSPLTEPVLAELEAVASSLRLARPKVPLISNVTGGFVDEEVVQPAYWARHLRQRVLFGESMALLHAQQLDFLLEIGPDPTLLGLDLCLRAAEAPVAAAAKWLPSLRRGHDDRLALLESAGRLWAAGLPLDWAAVHPGRPRAHLALPGYAFQRRRHWFEPDESVANEPPSPTSAAASASSHGAEAILAEVQAVISEVSGLEPADLPREANLLAMGMDSLMFVRAGRILERRFEVRISVKQFYEGLHRIGPLVDFLAARVTPSTCEALPLAARGVRSPSAPSVASVNKPSAPGLDPVWQAHFRLMERYLAGVARDEPATAGAPVAPVARSDGSLAVNFGGLNLEEEKDLSPRQREFLAALTERLVNRMRRSKAQTQAWRRPLADWKGSLQFKRSLKELKYPMVADRAQGSRLWDLDGNEYVDLALGMGVHFLGHAPAFIHAAVHRQLDRSAALGPQSDLAGEVARKICQLTGSERVSLAITGSGAVMLAQRLARAATGRPLVAQFAGAYHGIGSEVLVVAGEDGPVPLSPGVPRSVVENARVLDYGSEEALAWIRAQAGQLAAVMVEPVQSRRPGFQPHRFLRRLRRLTAELDIALIFDEMINGFRVHPGGAQAWFGIEADIVTYGKIVGGGLPLAVVAGKARYLDWIDGGYWQYGDDSAPSARTIFTGGTHNRHPLVLAAANAALDHMIAEGPALQEAVNRRTERLAQELTAFFEAEEVALRIGWFGSQFRLEALGSPFDLEVFYHLLLEQGFYTWEQRTCCLSVAHTDEEVDRLIAAVRSAVALMRAGGFALQAGPGAPRRVLPLSPVQERLFALCQREGAEAPYHLSGIWEVRGPVDPFRLQDAFHEIVRRHESLRTAFVLIGGRPCQYIVDEPRFFLETVATEGRPPAEVLAGFIRPMDLARPPLLRIGHAVLTGDRSLLLIDVHHIAADGLSMNIILREFAALYDGQALRPVPRQYRHAMEESRRQRATPEYQVQAAYWQRELAGELPVLELPSDRPRTREMDFRGDKCGLVIAPEDTRRLDALAREHGASLYMVLLGVFVTLLHRLTEAEDVIVGLPVAGRSGTENDGVVGMFVNSLPLRFRPSANQPFAEFLRAVRAVCLGAYDHADYAFGDLVEALPQPRCPDRNPIFDTMFAYENADDRLMRAREIEIRSIDQFEGSGMFDFNVDVIREAGALNLRFHYATRLFRRETILRWSAAYARLLQAVLARPEELLGCLPLLAPAEREQVMVAFNTGADPVPPPTTIIALWARAVAEHGERTALICGERRLTYDEVEARANVVAARLQGGFGVARGESVALLVEACDWMVVAVLGILKAGAAYVPIDPANPAERIVEMLQDCGTRILVVENRSAEHWHGVTPVVLAELAAAGPAVAPPDPGICPSDLAYIIYTSGSTGRPKGVMLEHGGVANSLLWRTRQYPFTPQNVTLLMPSYAFDSSVMDLFCALLTGGAVVVVTTAEKRDLPAQAERLRQERVTNLLLTPSLHSLYLEELAPAMRELRWVCVAGEATTRELVRRHFDRLPGVRLCNEYGPTENSVVTTFTELHASDEAVTIGRPVAGNQVYVLQRNGEVAGVGIPGELVVSGPGLARGYRNRPELSAAAFQKAPWDPALRIYRTGDQVRWRENGTLEFLGRRDGQVKLHGYRIELEEIENVLVRQPGVRAAAVRLVPMASGAQLVAYIVAPSGGDEAAWRLACQTSLPAYMTPGVFVRLAGLPLNPSGKVDRYALPVPEFTPARGDDAPPRGAREAVLAETWAGVLRLPAVGREDDYFQLGGDSIKGIQIVSRLLQRGWRLDLRWLFRHPTIATLAPLLEATRSAGGPSAGEPVGEVPLGPIQRWCLEVHGAWPNHFNQAVWLRALPRWETAALVVALQDVVTAHDAFRYRFSREGGRWRQHCSAGGPGLIVRVEDLRADATGAGRLDDLARAEQAGLNLEHGPMVRAVVVRLPEEDRLLWVAHHLVVDGVSWRILLEDLAEAYAARAAGRPVPSPVRSVSFGRWTAAVGTAVATGLLQDEVAYWRELLGSVAPRLPGATGSPGTVVARRAVAASMSGPVVAGVGQAAHAAFRTQGNELLVAALRMAHAEWNEGEPLALLLEGHGRDAALAELDVGRTVGWFTSVYPVRFSPVPADVSVAGVIRETKEQLRSVPRHGAGFGWLRATSEDPVIREGALPAFSFNFMGAFDEPGSAAGYVICPEQPPGAQDPRQVITEPIALSGHAAGGHLHWVLEYDSNCFPEAIGRDLLERFIAALGRIASATTAAGGGWASPADFALRGLSLAAFDRLVERRGWAPNAVEDIYPLSPMQRGLFYEALNAPDSEAYFEQMSFRLSGPMDLAAFRRSWGDLGARHPALRSVFVQGDGDGEIMQVVRGTLEIPVEVEDLSACPPEEQQVRVEVFRREDRSRPFALAEGPLMRVRIFQLSEACVEVVWSHHHIVMDGWCVGILYEDLMVAYEARAGGGEPRLVAPADYRVYLRWLAALDPQDSARYWRRELAEVGRQTPPPRQAAGGAAQYQCCKDKRTLRGPAWERLQQLAAGQGATTATLLQTLWGVLLARYNQMPDVIFGGIVSGRPEAVADVERMVGLFINTIPVRLRFEPGETLAQALRRFQAQALERRPHEYLPLAEILAQAEGRREVFDHLVVLENYPMEEELRGAGDQGGGKRARPRLTHLDGFERTHYDFTLVAVPVSGGLEVELTYNAAVFAPGQIGRIQAHLGNLVEQLAAQPGAPCLDVDLIPPAERRQLESWNATTAVFPTEASVVSLFDEQVARHPLRPAVSFGGASFSYAELDRAVRQLARGLQAAGVRPGDRVAIWLPRGFEMIVSLLGILRAGGCYVPLDPEYPEARLRFILEDSGAQVVVAHSGHRCPFAQHHEVLVDVDVPAKALPALAPVHPESAAYVIYTSGSTGEPKGCLISHRNVVRLLRNAHFDFEFGPEDVWVVAHSFCFDFSVWEVYGALLNGGRVVVAPREVVRDVRSFVDLVICERVTVLNQTPAAFYAFLEEGLQRGAHDFGGHLRYVIFGGDRLEPHYLAPWFARYGAERPALINMYGITETTVHVTFHRVTPEEIRRADGRSLIGRPLPETEVWVCDEQRRVLPIGVAGELYVGGSGVGLGYLNRPALTAERFLPDSRGEGRRLYRTGDLGRWREDGWLEYLGRNDHQVQVRGFRVELGEVEAACLGQPGISQAVVVPMEQVAGQVELAAYFVGERRSAAELRAGLAARLPQYMIPAYCEWLPAIPLTTNGKIDRRALPKPGARAVAAGAAPRNPTEQILLAIWREVLDLDAVGVHDNFFDLGGQSLKAVRLRAKIEEQFGVAVALRDLFAHPTIAELATLAVRPRADADLAALVAEFSPDELDAQLRRLEP